MNPAQLINQTSGKTEYYTDRKILEAARTVLGEIDLDPASSEKANQHVKARQFFTWRDDGLAQPWRGNVWMNHPFDRVQNPIWVAKLVCEYQAGNVSAALCITFAATSERWFQPLLAFPQCFLCPRTNFYTPDGKVLRGVTKGSVATYLGPDLVKFKEVFSKFGTIKIQA